MAIYFAIVPHGVCLVEKETMSLASPRTRAPRQLFGPGRRLTAGIVAVVLALTGAIASTGMAAFAADPEGRVTVSKTVGSGNEQIAVAPGGEFTYTINVGCEDNDCYNAALADTLPPEFAGFTIVTTAVSPSTAPSTSSYAGCTTTVTPNCTLNVAFLQDLGAGRVGLDPNRAGYVISITLKAPADLPPTWASNGVAVTNTARVTADNSQPASDGANVTVNVPITVDTTVGKTWAPTSEQYSPGASSTITLTQRNTSNVPASTLVLTDPTSAVGGQTTLSADNPFVIADFTGFAPGFALPAGADQVQVDAYVFNPATNSYNWVTGPPAATPSLPGGVTNAAVAGLRFTFSSTTGATITAAGSAANVPFTVAQRVSDRNTGTSLVGGRTVTNAASGTVTVPSQPPVTKTATAPHTITPLNVATSITKSIAPARIPEGTTAKATVTASNESNGIVSSLTVADLNYFTEHLAFSGFTAPLTWPSGATAGTVVWHYSDGSIQPQPLPSGSTPTPPAPPAGAHLTGFELVFTGAIPPRAGVTAAFGITPDQQAVATGEVSAAFPNTAGVAATNAAGTSTRQATAPLQVFTPDIEIGIDKKISPTSPVYPGGTVVTQIPTTTSSDSAYVAPTKITVTDVWGGGTGEFYNAFDVVGIAPTQVISGTTLAVEYTPDNGATWLPLTSFGPYATTQTPQYTIDPALAPTITGLRYTFENPAGYPQGTTVSPNAVYKARDTKRDGTGATSTSTTAASKYTNTATAVGQGTATGSTTPITSDTVRDTADASIITPPSGPGTLLAAKKWQKPDYTDFSPAKALPSQSGQSAATRLGWGVSATGYTEVTVTDDAAAPGAVRNTTFQAFDLTTISPVTYTNDPLLRWDTITKVELHNGTAWVTLPAPGGSWMDASGFKGWALTAAQQASTIGVRFTIVENTSARQASTDPTTPLVGSGVATSAANGARPLGLIWKLRNVVRDGSGLASAWVTGTQQFNSAGAGTVRNTVAVAGTRNGAPVGPRTESDVIVLLDNPPGVAVTKATQKSSIVVPQYGDVPAAGYPTNDFTIVAKNTSASRASYIRLTDPSCSVLLECSTSVADAAKNPFDGRAYSASTNPFEHFTLTKITFAVPAAINQTQSIVTLWHRSGAGVLSTTTLSMTAAAALAPAALADVIGVSVLLQGTDPATNGGLIPSNVDLKMTLSTQLRETLRSAPGTPVTSPVTVDNVAFAQTYDPVLSATSAPVYDAKSASVNLLAGKLGVTAAKTFSPSTIIEAQRQTPVTMTLRATQGDQTIAPHQVTIADTDADFWNTFRLTALGTVTLPDGADRVDVGVQVDGGSTWITTGPQAAATLPVLPAGATNANITGIRFVFSRADGGLFSNTAPPRAFSASAVLTVVLRDADRATGAAIAFPSTITNTVTSNAHRTESPTIYPDANASTDASIQLSPGTFQLDVRKDPQDGIHTVSPGDPNTWTLSFRNSGTGFLTLTQLADQLPATLELDGTPTTYATSAGGTLATTGITEQYDPATRKLTFTWPAGGARMSPGETFTLRVGISLSAGLSPTDRATNAFTVTTAQTLAACTNTSGNGQGTLAGLAANQCGTSNYLQPRPGANLLSNKGVKGDIVDPSGTPLVTGAVNTQNPASPCVADAEGYYRSPCAANSVVGGQDSWKITTVNSGTANFPSITIVDALPFDGDRLLATGGSRGSTYRPVLTGPSDIQVVGLPAGAKSLLEVTTVPSAQICVGTGATAWPADPTCANNPVAASWTPATSYTGSWAAVTGIRMTLDYSTRTGAGDRALRPGDSVSLYYATINVPVGAQAGGAPVTVPVTAQYAWNQHGVTGVPAGAARFSRAPVKAGVTLASGPIQITKAITGPGAQYAPTSFAADVACTVPTGRGGTVPVDLGANASVALTAANAYTVRVDGIPLGATCAVTERGALGTYGESARSITPTSVAVTQTAAAGAPVPPGQSVAITNTYGVTNLVVSKTVSTPATVGAFGPFSFTVACTTALGTPVTLGAADASFTLAGGASRTISGVPIGATCRVTETDSDGATRVATTVNGAPGAAPAASVPISSTGGTVAFTNTYAAGQLSLTKTVAGAGGPAYGSGPFTVTATCTYDGQSFGTYTVQLLGGQTKTIDEKFPVGTVCAIAETVNGGANDTTISTPSVVIPGPTGGATLGAVTVDVTNTFGLGSVAVTKARVGDGVATYGDGPFTALVVCTWVKDGQTLTIPLPNGGVVTLDAAGGYKATVTGLIAGATCTITETSSAGATGVSYAPADPADPTRALVTVTDASGTAPPASVTITNTFDTGSLVIDKKRVGTGVDLYGAGPFTMQVACTYLKDGVVTPVTLPNGGVVVLDAAGRYTATLDGIVAGATCVVTETDAGLAVATESDPVDGTVTIRPTGDPAGAAVVTVTNTFKVGHLTLTKTVDKPSVVVGGTLTYTITAVNDGELDLSGVTVTDVLPAGVSYVSSTPAAAYDAATHTLTWTIDSLTVGASRVFTVTATANTVGTVQNSATATLPPGPWDPTKPPPVTTLVTPPLPSTGGLVAGGVGLAGIALVLVGALLALGAVRRRRREA